MLRKAASRLLTTPRFRQFALAGLLFSLMSLLVFGLIYLATNRFLEHQLDRALEAELASLLAEGSGRLARTIEQRQAGLGTREFYYLYQDRQGRRLAGSLPAEPDREGWSMLAPPGLSHPDGDEQSLRALARRLPDGRLLMVARDTDDIDDISDFMEQSFGAGFTLTLLVALACGAYLSLGFLRRLDGMTLAISHIMAGDLAQRIPLGAGRDEFRELSLHLNAMLERIQDLMAGMEQVTTGIAHDLRTPLTRLRNRLECALGGAEGGAAPPAPLVAALEEVDGLLEIFNALLRIAQIESGARRSHFSAVDLSALLLMLHEIYGPVADDGGRRLRVEAPPGIALPGDKPLLVQMLVNLIENALRHTPPGTEVWVSLDRAADGTVRLGVRDNGPGVPSAERGKVLRRFYRMDASRRTPGTGLGLSLVQAVVGLHHGCLRLEDNQPGLAVWIELPPAAAAPA